MPGLSLSELVDLPALQRVLGLFCDFTGMPTAILDSDGRVLIARGWQDICTCFHRVHPTTAARCRESDAYIKAHLDSSTPVAYKCRNGLWDVAMPIVVEGEHIGTLFLGQFRYSDEGLDVGFFRGQAEEFGFDEEAYLAALQRVPCFAREDVSAMISHLATLADMLSETGDSNRRLQHELARRQRAEEALRLSEARYRGLVESASSAILTLNRAGQVTFVNEHAQRLFGYSAKETCDKGLFGTIIGDDEANRDAYLALWEQVGATAEGTAQAELEHRSRDGRLLSVAWTFRAIGDARTAGAGLLCIGNETTAQRAAQRMLLEAQSRYAALFEGIREAAFVADADTGTILDANRAAEDLLGLPRSRIIGRHQTQLHPQGDRDYAELFRSHLAEGGGSTVEGEVLTADGRVVAVEITPSIVTLSDGSMVNYGLFRAISERRSAEEALRRRQQELLEAQRLAHLGSWSYDPATGQPEWSDECFRISGLDPASGVPSFEAHRQFVHPDDWPTFSQAVEHAARNGEGYEIEVRFVHPDGGICHALSRGEAEYAPDGSVTRLHGTVLDITGRKEAEQKQRRTTEGLQAVVAVASELIRCTDTDALTRTAVEWAHRRLGLARCAIFLLKGDLYAGTYLAAGGDALRDERARRLPLPDSWGQVFRPRARGEANWDIHGASEWPWADGAPAGIPWTVWTPIQSGTGPNGMLCNDGGEEGAEIDPVQQDIAAVFCSLLGTIMEHKRTQEALEVSEERYRRVVETASEGVWSVSPDDTTGFVNQQLANALGYEVAEMLGRPITDFLPAEEIADHRQRMLVRRSGKGETYERRFWHRDGHVVTMLVSATPLQDREGRFGGSFAMLTDITERKRAEEQLRESRETAWAILNATDDIAFLLDRDLRILAANEAAATLLGRAAGELPGRPLGDFLPDRVTGDGDRSLGRVVEDGRRLRSEGVLGDRHLMTTAHPIFDAEAQVSKVAVFAQDITDIKKAENSQRLAAVGQLAAGVAHEFNNLLASMMMRAERASSLQTNDEYERLCDLVLRSTTRGADICRNLTTFARPRLPSRAPLYMEDPLEAALAVAARQIELAEISLERRYETSGRRVNADGSQLEQVFLNLIINSCHAMASGGQLILSTFLATDPGGREEVVAAVTDTGIGIAPENLARVFEPFFTTKGLLGEDETPGTGLGLSVSHGIVAAHGGTLTVRSQVAAGTTFELRLAALAQETPALPPAAWEPERPSPTAVGDENGKAILWAEDEQDLRDLVAQALSDHGYRVTACADAEEAAVRLAQSRFDLVLTDLLMPGGGGRHVIQRTRILAAPPPVIVLTGRTEPHITSELLALGAARCLPKPLSIREMLAAVGAVLADRRPAG